MADALLPLRAIDRRVRLLASRLEGPRIVLPTFGQSDHDGRPHIEVGERYAFVVCERGTEFERRTTLDLDELLYWSFQSTTFSMAVDWELAHRIPGEDARRQLFQHQRDLLEVLDPRWAIRRDEELLTVLREHPFADPAQPRVRDVRPYVGVGPVTFGMSPLRVRDELGAPESTRTNRSGDEVYRYPSVSLTFDLEGLAEVGLLPEAKPRIGPVDVLSPKGFSSLLRLDGQAYECVGLIVLLNLGLAVSGVHDNDRSQLAVTAFRRGRWDRLQDQMKPFRP